jgi:hypothetical protein
MKVLAVLLLASYALAHGGDDYHMFKNWAKTKAMESCWGEDNMKVYTVNMKKAVAKCNQVDAPELELPPYRSVDRFVNTMLSFARDMDSNQFEQLYKMMSVINEEHYDHKNYHNNRRYGAGYPSRTYMRESTNDDMPWYKKNNYEQMDDKSSMDKFKMMMTFKKMMSGMKNDDSFMMEKMMPYDMMKNKYNTKYGMNKMDMNKFEKMYAMISEMKSEKKRYDTPVAAMRSSLEIPDFEKMANFMMNFRSKREATNDALALNDRLKEKIQNVLEEQQTRVGNMTCVLKEMNCLNAENEIDVRAMKKDAEQYNMPSVWFKQRYEEIIDVCYEVATNLPAKLNEQEIVKGEFGTVNLGQIKSFMGCCKNAKQKLCMNQDTKKKIETNFGPIEEILESFKYQISEDQLFTQVNQLLKGSEDEYM